MKNDLNTLYDIAHLRGFIGGFIVGVTVIVIIVLTYFAFTL